MAKILTFEDVLRNNVCVSDRKLIEHARREFDTIEFTQEQLHILAELFDETAGEAWSRGQDSVYMCMDH